MSDEQIPSPEFWLEIHESFCEKIPHGVPTTILFTSPFPDFQNLTVADFFFHEKSWAMGMGGSNIVGVH